MGNGAVFREQHNIAADTKIFCLLAGSRKGEVKRHIPIYARAIGLLARTYPNLAIFLAAPPHVMPIIAPFLNDCPFPVIIASDEEDKKNGIAASDFAFVKSGTVAFEVAMAKVPMLIMYKVNKISAWLMRRMIKTKFVNLINILLGKEVIPELIQERARPLMLASCANTMLAIADAKKNQQENIEAALKMLTPKSGAKPSDEAAKVVLQILGVR